MCLYNGTWRRREMCEKLLHFSVPLRPMSCLAAVVGDVAVATLNTVRTASAPLTPTHPCVQQIPAVWAELDHTLGGGCFVD